MNDTVGFFIAATGLAIGLAAFALGISVPSLDGLLVSLVVLSICGIIGFALSVRAFVVRRRVGERTRMATAGIAVSILTLALTLVVLAVLYVVLLGNYIPDLTVCRWSVAHAPVDGCSGIIEV